MYGKGQKQLDLAINQNTLSLALEGSSVIRCEIHVTLSRLRAIFGMAVPAAPGKTLYSLFEPVFLRMHTEIFTIDKNSFLTKGISLLVATVYVNRHIFPHC